MEEYWLDQLDEDLKDMTSPAKLGEDTRARERSMRDLSMLFLKIWMRFAIDSGLKMGLTPPDEEFALYEGKNSWKLSEGFNFSALAELIIQHDVPREHSLRAESYVLQGRERTRIIFSLEEERIRDQPILVNYLVYDSLAKDFEIAQAIENLRPGLLKWYLTIAENEPSILWNFCKENYECIGV